ncbi:hypothetical protein EON66_09145, partial [archaeon]
MLTDSVALPLPAADAHASPEVPALKELVAALVPAVTKAYPGLDAASGRSKTAFVQLLRRALYALANVSAAYDATPVLLPHADLLVAVWSAAVADKSNQNAADVRAEGMNLLYGMLLLANAQPAHSSAVLRTSFAKVTALAKTADTFRTLAVLLKAYTQL